MLIRIRPRLSYANVMATVAIFLALGGISYAAFKLPKNSVGSKQLKPRAVKTSDLGKNAVTSLNVSDGSLLRDDFAAGQLPGGPRGDQGPPGQDATNLFAYVADQGAAFEASVQYGEGATGVSDPAGDNTVASPYVVGFNRDLTGCVASVTSGLGQPDGSGAEHGAIGAPFADIAGSQVDVAIYVGGVTNALQDRPFMVSVFC